MIRENLIALFVLIGYIVIPNLDAIFIYPKTSETVLKEKVRCHDYPQQCWIQLKRD